MARYQRKDALYQRAKREGYASRAAYKLLEIQDKERLLQRGQRVIDLGCWPGGWLQVAADLVGDSGRVVGVDIKPLDAALGRTAIAFLEGDFGDAAIRAELLRLAGGPADVLLCDAAPKLSGVRAVDRAAEESLLDSLREALPELLRPGGSLVAKVFESPEAQAFAKALRKRFVRASLHGLRATRKGSDERYLLGRELLREG